MKKVVFVSVVLSFLGLLGCKKNVVEPQIDISSKYVPLDSGYSWTYQMDSIVYSGFVNAKPDTFSYKIKNEVVGVISDSSADTSYRIEKWYMLSSSNTWNYVRTYSETKSKLAYLRNEHNKLKLVLALPVLKDKTWDGNQYNSDGFVDFYFENVHSSEIVGNIAYDSVSTVIQDEAKNAIKSFFVIEKYASNVGLIYREEERLENLNTSTQKGFKYKLTLLSFEQ